eukprot:scaffold4074_cov30-Phaeocystis_antarctica.AAC.1
MRVLARLVARCATLAEREEEAAARRGGSGSGSGGGGRGGGGCGNGGGRGGGGGGDGGVARLGDAALWLLQELVCCAARFGRPQLVGELTCLVHSCAHLPAFTPSSAGPTVVVGGGNVGGSSAAAAAAAREWICTPPPAFREAVLHAKAEACWADAPRLPRRVRLAVLRAAAHVLRATPRRQASALKRHFVEAGGLLSLLLILSTRDGGGSPSRRTDAEGAATAAEGGGGGGGSGGDGGGGGGGDGGGGIEQRRAALLAVGELVAESEAAKTALGATLGGAALAQALRGCPALLDRGGFDVLLELACNGGSFRRVLGRAPSLASLYPL